MDHGSDRNIDKRFFERVTADHYLICGNGGHGNPEPGTLQMLFDVRPDLNYQIHMTYGPAELKRNKTYKKHGNHTRLAELLNSPERRSILHYPKSGARSIDVELT